jgi:hypothetical protein
VALTVDWSAGCRGIVRLSGLACPLVRDHQADPDCRAGRGYGRPQTRARARPGCCPGATGPSGCHREGRADCRTPAWSLNRRTAQGAQRHAIPDAAGIPYTYWSIGRTDRKVYLTAEKEGRLQDLPSNHSPKFLPPLQPTLRTGTEALATAALAWLAPEQGT